MSRFRVLVLGLGFFGKNWLTEVSACQECEVAGVVAKHPELLASAGEEFGIPPGRRFTTIQEGIITLVGEGGTLRLEADSQVRCYRDDAVEAIRHEAMAYTDTAYALREFLAAIREGRCPETHVEDNVRSFAMAAAAISSVETGRPVAVAPLVVEAPRTPRAE